MNLTTLFLVAAVLSAAPIDPTHVDNFSGHPRMIVISDIGNEPDDQMSLVRLLLYSNEIDIEGLVASTSTWQKAVVHPETMRTLIKAYGEVQPNLLKHAQGWPTAAELENRVYSGQTAYGMAATGLDKMSEGAQAIIRAADSEDSRPLWISLWGGSNTLAQALLTVRATRTAAELLRFVEKLRVYSISDQDDAGPWIRRDFPDLFYIVQPSTAANIITRLGLALAATNITGTARARTSQQSRMNGWMQIFGTEGRSAKSIRNSRSLWRAIRLRT